MIAKSIKCSGGPNRSIAFAVFELLIVLFVIALISPLILLSIARHKARPTPKIRCVNQLRNIGISAQIFATDHGGLFPWQTDELKLSSNAADVFLSLSNELTIPAFLICPADTRQRATNWTAFHSGNVSYFVGLNSNSNDPGSVLAGDRNVTIDSRRTDSGRINISTNAILGWDSTQHRYVGNLCMADGSVQIGNNDKRLNDTIHRLKAETNETVFLFP